MYVHDRISNKDVILWIWVSMIRPINCITSNNITTPDIYESAGWLWWTVSGQVGVSVRPARSAAGAGTRETVYPRV